jgi:hypothetical protein
MLIHDIFVCSWRETYCVACSAGLPGCECVVPAVLARPYCHICSGCFTHACACIAPPSGVYSRFRRQITTLSCGPKSWSCAVIADRENLQSLLDCLCHCSSSELSYKRTHVLLGGLAGTIVSSSSPRHHVRSRFPSMDWFRCWIGGARAARVLHVRSSSKSSCHAAHRVRPASAKATAGCANSRECPHPCAQHTSQHVMCFATRPCRCCVVRQGVVRPT